MPDPVHAWAAVAPDGTLRTFGTMRPDRRSTENALSWLVYRSDRHTGLAAALADAYRAGWLVVPVKIVPMERTDG